MFLFIALFKQYFTFGLKFPKNNIQDYAFGEYYPLLEIAEIVMLHCLIVECIQSTIRIHYSSGGNTPIIKISMFCALS